MSTRNEIERIAAMLAELAHDLNALLVRYPVAGQGATCALCGQPLSPAADLGSLCGRCESTLICDTRGAPSPTQTQESGMKGGTAGATMERTSPSTAGTNAPVGNFPSDLSMIPALCGQIIGAVEAVIANHASYEHYAGLGDTRPAQEWQKTLARSI